MIVGHRKHIQEIKQMLAPHKRILVLGCGTCVTVCLAGGEREVGMIASALRIAYRLDNDEREIIEATIERQCENQFIEDAIDEIQNCDAVLSLACGAGVQAIAERFPTKPVYPGLDTKFIGILQEQGIWTEKCIACGKCIVGLYGAVCPLTRCSKGLLSGPCGYSRDGKCEVSADIECGWHLIYNRLKEIGQLDRLLESAPLTDWSKSHEGGCRKLIREDQRITLDVEAS
ncbi:MAG: methylenetetrahydrofolate reductase C-terminal domain-containing protein [Armatimonadetes bacterium]|nr:methylenetetrahydrofolate reductase C-terminal domain-containing protein [Armatimonadota bacterium]